MANYFESYPMAPFQSRMIPLNLEKLEVYRHFPKKVMLIKSQSGVP